MPRCPPPPTTLSCRCCASQGSVFATDATVDPGSFESWAEPIDRTGCDVDYLADLEQVTPVVLGGGVPASEHGGERGLELLEATPLPGSSSVVLEYAARGDR